MITITASQFKTYFSRGQFTYGDTVPAIRDIDIEAAIAEASAVFNQEIYPSDEIATIALYYLTAHFLLLDTESNGQAVYTQSSRSADGLSESVQLPSDMMDGPLAFYTTTYYGQKWIALTRPYMGGAVYCVAGATTP